MVAHMNDHPRGVAIDPIVNVAQNPEDRTITIWHGDADHKKAFRVTYETADVLMGMIYLNLPEGYQRRWDDPA